ncbi:MAG: glycosyltransferase, partial [Anaerovoracaceae bacterium]
ACHKQLNRQRKVIVYAGSPGKKDLFEPIMKAIKLLSDVERKKLTLRIIGASKEQIAKNANMPLCELEKMADVLVFVPRMSHEGVMEQLTKAHFVILLRPAHMRYAKAGFPTKVPESLATGTPVICNLTSDLGMFLRDGENALIADDEGVESVLTVLRRAINVDEEQMIQMCAQARATAEEKFDYRLYAEGMGQFINHEHEA